MIEPVSFDPRVVRSSRKAHKCVTCGYVMPKGTVYVAYPCKDNLGFRTLHLCVECTYLMNFKNRGAEARDHDRGIHRAQDPELFEKKARRVQKESH